MENIQDGRWENVPGALSSQGGQDFCLVLESLVRIKAPAADVPLPESGRWLHAARSWATVILSPGASSTPRRVGASHRDGNVYLLSSILMDNVPERFSLSPKACQGIPPPGGKARKGTASGAENSAGTAGERVSAGGFCTEHSADSRGVGYEDERAPTLRAGVVPGVAIDFNPTDSRIRLKEEDICQTLVHAWARAGIRFRWYSAFHPIRVTPCCRKTRTPGSMKRIPAERWTAAAAHRHAIRVECSLSHRQKSPATAFRGSMIGRKEQERPAGRRRQP